ncbi:MAG TPA: adenylate/guanylate cyclase domain-containing protein [Chthoniobacterales bacterium]|nr:adenylate/guanylate cyclase domain-containing protein [Chthoniobacterales bacterium]
MRLREHNLTRALAVLTGSFFATVLGLACLRYSFADGLVRLSYDLPFLWRSTLPTEEIAIVYLDDFSAKQLNQPLDGVWSRTLHTRLLDRLTEEKARLVFYDVVFDAPDPDPAVDAEFASAMQRNGKVVLGAALDEAQMGEVQQERIFPPSKSLRKAAAGFGVLAFKPIDPDYGVRRMFFGTSTVPSATWKAAHLLGAPITRQARESIGSLWINYYGPRDTFSSVNIAQALQPGGVPVGYFKDKIVLIGARSTVGYLGSSRDEFSTPYARISRKFCPGVEVHSTILLNLLHTEWLRRMAPGLELALVLLVGLSAGALGFLRPGIAASVAVAVSFGLVGCACALVWHERIWFAWLIPSAVQLPVGLFWSVGAQYLLEARRRKELRKAFGFYLSPAMADRISDSDFDLRPGGKLVEVSVIFTDLENFTTLSEKLHPTEVSSILTSYFTQTTQCILENKGTIIKYIGDAVFAAWGAPVEEPEHAIRAAEAACDLRLLSELEIQGKKLRTRIGLHSGEVLAGNLGSSFRFDYTMIGDAVNFASRLESLNKYLHTQALVSDVVRSQLGDKFVMRRLGEFRVAGKTESVVIHELLCRSAAQNGESQWIEPFEAGLISFRAGDLPKARDLMRQTCGGRGGSDGPAEFYLRKIEILSESPLPTDWDGVVDFAEK